MSKNHRWLILLVVFGLGVVVVFLSSRATPPSAGEPRDLELEEDPYIRPPIGSGLGLDDKNNIVHVSLPTEVRGLYWTATTAATERAQELLVYMKETGLNTVVIDIKMDNGELAFPSEGLLGQLAQEEIYRIARIAVMRDGVFAAAHPDLALKTETGEFWKDNIGSVWVDPAAREVAEYAIELGKESYARGFDEVQFDYVRFASDGETGNIVYPVYRSERSMIEVMQNFFKTVGSTMRAEQIPVSFDLFGMTFWSHDDFNIGQRLIDALPYSDFVSPMVYPSHYPDGFEGFAHPAEVPYEIVKQSLDKGTQLIGGVWSGSEEELRWKWRPWLQDFDIGAVYTSDMIEAQIRAARDAGASGWILWNARNVYEPANYEPN